MNLKDGSNIEPLENARAGLQKWFEDQKLQAILDAPKLIQILGKRLDANIGLGYIEHSNRNVRNRYSKRVILLLSLGKSPPKKAINLLKPPLLGLRRISYEKLDQSGGEVRRTSVRYSEEIAHFIHSTVIMGGLDIEGEIRENSEAFIRILGSIRRGNNGFLYDLSDDEIKEKAEKESVNTFLTNWIRKSDLGEQYSKDDFSVESEVNNPLYEVISGIDINKLSRINIRRILTAIFEIDFTQSQYVFIHHQGVFTVGEDSTMTFHGLNNEKQKKIFNNFFFGGHKDDFLRLKKITQLPYKRSPREIINYEHSLIVTGQIRKILNEFPATVHKHPEFNKIPSTEIDQIHEQWEILVSQSKTVSVDIEKLGFIKNGFAAFDCIKKLLHPVADAFGNFFDIFPLYHNPNYGKIEWEQDERRMAMQLEKALDAVLDPKNFFDFYDGSETGSCFFGENHEIIMTNFPVLYKHYFWKFLIVPFFKKCLERPDDIIADGQEKKLDLRTKYQKVRKFIGKNIDLAKNIVCSKYAFPHNDSKSEDAGMLFLLQEFAYLYFSDLYGEPTAKVIQLKQENTWLPIKNFFDNWLFEIPTLSKIDQ